MVTSYNHGDVICLATNGSGYDSRIIFDCATRKLNLKVDVIPNGSRIMQMKITPGKPNGNFVVFRDTLAHFGKKSLSDLVKTYNDGSQQLAKGIFPYYALTRNNEAGPFPSIDKFDLSAAKTDEQRQEILKFIEDNKDRQDYNPLTECIAYCMNDVKCQAMVCKVYTEIMYSLYKKCPFKYMTAPSFVHALSIQRITKDLELPDKKDPNYIHRIEELARDGTMAILKPQEAVMGRKALRGGRTDARAMYTEITPEEKAQGVTMEYADVNSMYPWWQAKGLYPRGIPTIYVVDEAYYPCFKHQHSLDFCTTCPLDKKYSVSNGDLKKHGLDVRNKWDISRLSLDIGGFIHCSVTAPNMLHPVLMIYDEATQKAITPCGTFTGTFTIQAVKVALTQGYVINHVYRVDEYAMKESQWADFTIDLYLGKLYASESAPGPERQRELYEFLEREFEAGDRLDFTPERWGYNKVRRELFKLLINCGWGKHCESPIKDQKTFIDYENCDEQIPATLFANFSDGKTVLKGVIPVGGERFLYKYLDNDRKPNLSRTYIAAGAMVPDYARLHLWSEMVKIGKDWIYNDTDSGVYKKVPGKYSIPITDVWGGWEAEHTNIMQFVGVGPKTYAFKKLVDGKEIREVDGKEVEVAVTKEVEVFKCKGLYIKRAHKNIVNYNVMAELNRKTLQTGDSQKVDVPQTSFVWFETKYLQTRNMIKHLNFSLDGFKGLVDETGYVYPYGYTGNDFVPHPCIK